MFKLKVYISIIIFTLLLIGTSIIKNQTREIEKKIYNLSVVIHAKEKDFNESQLDFFYLTSPESIERKIDHLAYHQYFPMEYSKIFLDFSDYLDLHNRLVIKKENQNEKAKQKKKKY